MRNRRFHSRQLSHQVLASSLHCLILTTIVVQIAAAQTSYFVDAVTGSDGNTGTSPSAPWKTISRVNSASLRPGDNVLFRRGQTWREQLLPPNSGSAGIPITFSAYGMGTLPIISGADLVTRWADNGNSVPNTWMATAAIQPNQVFFNNIRGTPVGSVAACDSPGKWYWIANALYTYGTSNPVSVYATPGIEACARNEAFDTYSRSFVTITDLQFTKGNDRTTGTVYIGTHNVTMSGVVVSDGAGDGILCTTGDSAVMIAHCQIHNNLSRGISTWHGLARLGHENYIQNSVIYDNLTHGIEITDNYWIIQTDTVRDNGTTSAGFEGIELYSPNSDGWARHNIVRFNTILGQMGTPGDGVGIQCDGNADSNLVYYNVCFGNQGSGFTNQASNFNEFYNNTSYGNCLTSGPGGSEWVVSGPGTHHVVFENNIGYCTTSAHAINVAPNTYNTTGLIFSNNIWFAPQAAHFYSFGGVEGNTLSGWNASSGARNDLNADPMWVDPGSHNFSLQPNSPAIDAGLNVGLAMDYLGNPIDPNVTHPDIGACEFFGSPPSFPVGSLIASPDVLDKPGRGILTWMGSNASSASIDNGIGAVPVDGGTLSVAIDTSVTYTLTLANRMGIRNYKATIKVLSIVTSTQHTEPPIKFVLGQNYPNPFNPVTTIRYEVPKAASLSICVYDVLGRLISELVNGEKSAGTYEVEFDGSGLPSGPYFCFMKSASLVQSRKLLLLR